MKMGIRVLEIKAKHRRIQKLCLFPSTGPSWTGTDPIFRAEKWVTRISQFGHISLLKIRTIVSPESYIICKSLIQSGFYSSERNCHVGSSLLEVIDTNISLC